MRWLCGALMLTAAVFATLVYPAQGLEREVGSPVAVPTGH